MDSVCFKPYQAVFSAESEERKITDDTYEQVNEGVVNI